MDLKDPCGKFLRKNYKNLMNSLLKVVIYLKDVPKPIVLTCSREETEQKEKLIDTIQRFMSGETKMLKFDSGDIFMCPDSSIYVKSILITTDKNNG